MEMEEEGGERGERREERGERGEENYARNKISSISVGNFNFICSFCCCNEHNFIEVRVGGEKREEKKRRETIEERREKREGDHLSKSSIPPLITKVKSGKSATNRCTYLYEGRNG